MTDSFGNNNMSALIIVIIDLCRKKKHVQYKMDIFWQGKKKKNQWFSLSKHVSQIQDIMKLIMHLRSLSVSQESLTAFVCKTSGTLGKVSFCENFWKEKSGDGLDSQI